MDILLSTSSSGEVSLKNNFCSKVVSFKILLTIIKHLRLTKIEYLGKL